MSQCFEKPNLQLAFGLFARCLPPGPEFNTLINNASGLELADSITGDSHKMLNVVCGPSNAEKSLTFPSHMTAGFS